MRPSDEQYMLQALNAANSSHDQKTKVGVCLVNGWGDVSIGYNWSITDKELDWFGDEKHKYMIHAEMDAILKAHENNRWVKGSTLYTTLAPCLECTKYIYSQGIIKVVYSGYKRLDGIELLKELGVETEEYKEEVDQPASE